MKIQKRLFSQVSAKPRVAMQRHSRFSGRRTHDILTRRRAWLVVAFLLASVSQAAAQTDPCQSIRDQISHLRTEMQNKKDDYRDRGNRDHKPMAAKIRKVEREYQPRIAAKQREYDQCRLNHGGKPDQAVTFTGTATMTTTNTSAPGPFVRTVTLGLTFLKFDHTTLAITNFPAIVVGPFSTSLGTNTTTVRFVNVQATIVNPNTGKMSITLLLHFTNSLPAAGASDLPITLSTENTGGSRINHNNRQVTLAGTGTFSGGFLGGSGILPPSTCSLAISGTLSALP